MSTVSPTLSLLAAITLCFLLSPTKNTARPRSDFFRKWTYLHIPDFRHPSAINTMDIQEIN